MPTPLSRTATGGRPQIGMPAQATPRVLVVEDEPGIAGFVRRGLIFEGFAVEVTTNGGDALASIAADPPDMVVLDIMLPGVDGLEVLRRVRAADAAEGRPPLPVLLLTARDAVPDGVLGLGAGADDYLVKPFAFEELVARIRAVLRRARTGGEPTTEVRRFADLALDVGARTVQRGDRPVELTTREFDLLALLVRHPNQVLTRATIMDRVWGPDFYGDSNVLEVFVANLRRALEAGGEPRLIQTVRGVGYVLRAAT
ncbi:MAG: Phosphate regulon transcriptional regulatory protein PhoB (SphR) [uncultured Thermomicrobiales bacterium]|uniref:Phosphate regulon transcriptional regulatory protein PhoB (SphR) n=1 Tax=uncultured Thermomicrobiales bacterium TaxID=1645740 RepID=A0A6J4UNB0_9BACT|nr:MAG: Phosphate regulon transcriptional regulatory protein PhoB (SphR) [uncultured Thermomicrobiales bacterium]